MFLTFFLAVCTLVFLSILATPNKMVLHTLTAFSQRPPPCGQVCEYVGQIRDEVSNSHYRQMTKDVNCRNILGRMAWDKYPVTYPPPRDPPPHLSNAFTQNGKVPFKDPYYLNEMSISPGSQRVFSKSYVDDFVAKVQNEEDISSYGLNRSLAKTVQAYRDVISNKNGMVIGTIGPWVEAILLSVGARKLTTLEYSNISFEHPQIQAVHPTKMAQRYLNGEFVPFDFAVSFSSLEHSGLGRYGDPINPYGDMEAVAQVWCMMKPGATFLLGLPVSQTGESFIRWNVHRVYGTARLPHITANWDLIEWVKCTDIHALLVLKKL